MVLDHEIQLRGAMAADDERLRIAGERVGINVDCDTPEWMADEIITLRADLGAEKEKLRWRKFPDEKPEKDDPVLVVIEGSGVDLVFFRNGRFLTFAGTTVSCWQPLNTPLEGD